MSKKGFSKELKNFIKNRDNNVCQFPKCRNRKNLQVHHIIPRAIALRKYRWSLEKINSMHNGITVCKYCHNKLHFNNLWKEYNKYFKALTYKYQ